MTYILQSLHPKVFLPRKQRDTSITNDPGVRRLLTKNRDSQCAERKRPISPVFAPWRQCSAHARLTDMGIKGLDGRK
jgi:hypothetical protein